MDNSKRTRLVTIVVAVAVVVIGVFGAVHFYSQKQNELISLQTQNKDLNVVLTERDSIVNELVDAFTEIEDNLKFIKKKRSQLTLENEEGQIDKKQAIIDDINMMNEMLEQNSRRIEELEKRLKNSGIEIRSFRKKIAQLNKTIEEQNEQIGKFKTEIEKRDLMLADFSEKVSEMETEIAKQTDTIEAREKEIEEKVNELNKAYMAYGTYKELKEKGLLTKDGGFMWIGRNKTIREDFDQEYFTELNIQDTKTIPLHAKKATMVSEHPNNSYTLVEEDGMIAYLKINNPEEFWRISKYAVIEVK